MKSIAEQIKQEKKERLDDAVKYFGGVTAMADYLGITRQCIYAWLNRGSISAAGAKLLEELTQGKFKASDLRPSASKWRNK